MNDSLKSQNYSRIFVNISYLNNIHIKEFDTEYMLFNKGDKLKLTSILQEDRLVAFAIWLDGLYETESSKEIPSYHFGEGIYTKKVGAYIDKLHLEQFEVFNFTIHKEHKGNLVSIVDLKYKYFKA